MQEQERDYGFGKRTLKAGERWKDTRRIDIREPGEIDFWAKFFGVEGIDILFAVDKVGTQASRVRQYLERGEPLH